MKLAVAEMLVTPSPKRPRIPRSGERVYKCCNECAGVKGRGLVEFEKNSATSLIFVLSFTEETDVRV